MLTTPHLLVGAAIGNQMPYVWQVVPLAAASHFVLDAFPHVQGYIEVEDLRTSEAAFLIGDLALGLGLVAVLAYNNPAGELMWLGALVAILPDFHHIIQVLFGSESLKKYHNFHMKFHFKKDIRVIPGFATQILTIFLAVLLITRFI